MQPAQHRQQVDRLRQVSLTLPVVDAPPQQDEHRQAAPSLSFPKVIQPEPAQPVERSLSSLNLPQPDQEEPPKEEKREALIPLQLDDPVQPAAKQKSQQALKHLQFLQTLKTTQVEHHPVLQRFPLLSCKQDYEEIEEIAKASLCDIRAFRGMKALRVHYVQYVVRDFCRYVTTLLPKSTNFYAKLENDQQQIDCLIPFVKELTNVTTVAALGKMIPAQALAQLVGCLKGFQSDRLRQHWDGMVLLTIKRAIHAHLLQISLPQVQRELDFTRFLAISELLQKDIATTANQLEKRHFATFLSHDQATFEDRTIVPYKITIDALTALKIEGGEKEVDATQLAKDFELVQKGNPTKAELDQFLRHLLSLSTETEELTHLKVSYLMKMAERYQKLRKLASCQRATDWVNYALTTLQVHPSEHLRGILLGMRGELWLQQAAMMRMIQTEDDQQARDYEDWSYCDFLEASKSGSPGNHFVNHLQKEEALVAIEEQQPLLQRALKAYPNYPEASFRLLLLSLRQIEQRKKTKQPYLQECQEALEHFDRLEQASFYHLSRKGEQETITLDTVRGRLNDDLLANLVELFVYRVNHGYKQTDVGTLALVCRAQFFCQRLMDQWQAKLLKTPKGPEKRALKKRLRKVERRYLHLLIKKGFLYGQAHLLHAAERTFCEVRAFAYQKRCSVPAIDKPIKEIFKKCDDKDVPSSDGVKAAALLHACFFHVLKETDQINAKKHLHRTVPTWENFVERILQTTTFRELIEATLTTSKALTDEELMVLLALANAPVTQPEVLDQFKQCLHDALVAYQQEKSSCIDRALEAQQKAKDQLKEEKQFHQFLEQLSQTLRQGHLIRPGSTGRKELTGLAKDLKIGECDPAAVKTTLKNYMGAVDEALKLNFERLADCLEECLDLSFKQDIAEKDILVITGKNIFLSEILTTVKESLHKHPAVYELHIIGTRVYIDTHLRLPGMNVGIGGNYVECLQVIREGKQEKLTIDLSGQNGEDAAMHIPIKAKDGVNPSDSGDEGDPGRCGAGGQPGGDLYIEATQTVGFDAEHIERINLSGGTGGRGANGQNGGDGVKGNDGLSGMQRARLCHPLSVIHGVGHRRKVKAHRLRFHVKTWTTHHPAWYGLAGDQGGSGGKGGDAGLGGMGGERGVFTCKETSLKIENSGGDRGKDGEPGEGGEGKLGGNQGQSYYFIHETSYFDTHAYEDLKDTQTYNDANYIADHLGQPDTPRRDGTKGDKGKTAEQVLQQKQRRRQSVDKRKLNQATFQKGRQNYLLSHAEAGEGHAFDGVAGDLAAARQTEGVLNNQLSALLKQQTWFNHTYQITTEMLQQQNKQVQSVKQHEFVAVGPKVIRDSLLLRYPEERRQAIQAILNGSEKEDTKSLFPILKWSPVTDKIENVVLALDQLNLSQWKSAWAVVQLFKELDLMLEGKKRSKATLDSLKAKSNALKEAVILQLPEQLVVQHPGLIRCVKEVNQEKAEQLQLLVNFHFVIQDHFDRKIHDAAVRHALIKFLQKSRLANQMRFLTSEELSKKRGWLEAQIKQKVLILLEEFYQQHRRQMRDQTLFQTLVAYGCTNIDLLVGQQEKPSNFLAHERAEWQRRLIALRQQKLWFDEHSFELYSRSISTKEICENPDAYYLHIPLAKENDVKPEGAPSEAELAEEMAPEVHEESFKETPSYQRYLKRLKRFSGQESQDTLDRVYRQQQQLKLAGLVEVFVAFVKQKKSLNEAEKELVSFTSTSIDDVYQLRMHYFRQESNYLTKKACNFLRVRHLTLAAMPLERFEESDRAFALSLLFAADKLFETHALIPRDFLSDALQWIDSQKIPFEPFDFFAFLTEKVTAKASQSVDEILESEVLSDEESFVLYHKELTYPQLIRVMSHVWKNEKAHQRLLKFFRQKFCLHGEEFAAKWKHVQAKIRRFDHYLKTDQTGPLRALQPVADLILEELDYLDDEEERHKKIEEMMEIIDNRGPYQAHNGLRELACELVKQLGRIDDAPDYNELLERATGDQLSRGNSQLAERMLAVPFDSEHFVPYLIAVRHFAWSKEQLLQLYEQVEANQTVLAKDLKRLIKQGVIDCHLREKGTVRKQDQTFFEARQSLLKVAADIDLPLTELWIQMLDTHFVHADRDGQKRQELYKQATTLLEQELAKPNQNLKGCREQFVNWQRETFNNLKGKNASIDKLVRHFSEEDLKTLYWRGLAPYSDVREKLESVTLTEEQERLVQRKFCDELIAEDRRCLLEEMREKEQQAERDRRENLAVWSHELQKENLTVQEIRNILASEKMATIQPDASIEDQFLDKLELRLKDEKHIYEVDIDFLALIKAKQPTKEAKIKAIEEKVMALTRKREEEINQIHRDFLIQIDEEQNDTLREEMRLCSARIGKQAMVHFTSRFTKVLKSLNIAEHRSVMRRIFQILPLIEDHELALSLFKKENPALWALRLHELALSEQLLTALTAAEYTLPQVNLSGKADHDKDVWYLEKVGAIQEKNKGVAQLVERVIVALQQAKKITHRKREILLKSLIDCLARRNAKQLFFSLRDFAELVEMVFTSEKGVQSLSAHLQEESSTIAASLFQSSFEALKDGLTTAWLEGELAGGKHSLSEEFLGHLKHIESKRQRCVLEKLVRSLQAHGAITAEVKSAVKQFAEGLWVLDDSTLDYLKEGKFTEIASYSRKKQQKERTLLELTELMAKHQTGVNHALQDLFEGSPPTLVRDIEEIIRLREGDYKKWGKGEISQWAEENRSEHFLSDPLRIKQAMAIVSQAFFRLYGFHLRHAQLIALWVMLRKGQNRERGCIGQMATGEGKTAVFAALGVILGMGRVRVDVVTTSYVLAIEGAEKYVDLFQLFHLTVTNNCDRACETDEEERKKRYGDDQHVVDVVYGDVGSFERDVLQSEFYDTKTIPSNRLQGQRCVFVDEVDGLFLDNASMVLYLSHQLDTLRFFQNVFVEIWTLVNQEGMRNVTPAQRDVIKCCERFLMDKLKGKSLDFPQFKVPNASYMELMAIAERKLSTWICSALMARTLRINNHYVITDQLIRGKSKKSVIVMDKGTGTEQISLKWSNGLHQFLQLKHGLELSSESLKAVFLSNYHFFCSYAPHVYGLSGTLGTLLEQEQLETLYQVDLCKFPRFKPGRFLSYPPILVHDPFVWLATIRERANREICQRQRALLIITESVEDATWLADNLRQAFPKLATYLSTFDEVPFNRNGSPYLNCGDLVIATNIAGRGTDFKVSGALEINGGIHVIESYFPANERIEKQGFRRTARNGCSGSGEFILFHPDEKKTFGQLREERAAQQKQLLEQMRGRELEKIKFEQELLREIEPYGRKIPGFQALLEEIKSLMNEQFTKEYQAQSFYERQIQTESEYMQKRAFYQKAQVDSLCNRWAYWLDHFDEKIALVHITGKEAIIGAFVAFREGVLKDFQTHRFGLVIEPAELIKLGSQFRDRGEWGNAGACYELAAKDPSYAYAKYYYQACYYISYPDASKNAKKHFRKGAKEAKASILRKSSLLQKNAHAVTAIATEAQRSSRQQDFGNPFKQRSQEAVEIWSIFLSAIDSVIGTTITGEEINQSACVKSPAEGQEILEQIQPYYRPTRCKDVSAIQAPAHYQAVIGRLKKGDRCDVETLKKQCQDMETRETLKAKLPGEKEAIYLLQSVSSEEASWPKDAVFDEQVKFILASLIDEIQQQQAEYETDVAFKEKIRAALKEHPFLHHKMSAEETETFLTFACDKALMKDCKITLPNYQELKQPLKKIGDLIAVLKKNLPVSPYAAEVIAGVCFTFDEEKKQITFKPSFHLSELHLPKDSEEAAKQVLQILEQEHALKPPRIKVQDSVNEVYEKLGEHFFKREEFEPDRLKELIAQREQMKNANRQGNKPHDPDAAKRDREIGDLQAKQAKAKEGINSVRDIIEQTLGVIYQLKDKKTTAEFASFIRRVYYDHNKNIPDEVDNFVELGLDMLVDLIEKIEPDPPAWYKIAAVVALGVAQIVAGTIIKAYLPVAGEFLGNMLISTGIDDIMFAVNCVKTKQFSWDAYGKHKEASLKSAAISSAIGAGIDFGINACKFESASKAWDYQKLSGLEKAAKHSGSVSVTLGSYMKKELTQRLISTGLSQAASLGLNKMIKIISKNYEKEIRKAIEEAVNREWTGVRTQTDQIFAKEHNHNVIGYLQQGIAKAFKNIEDSHSFDQVIRASRHVVPKIGQNVGGKMGCFVSSLPDLSQIGVSLPQLKGVVGENIKVVARHIRDTNAIKEGHDEGQKIEEAEYKKKLDDLKNAYIEKLYTLFQQLLKRNVYAPMISIATNVIVDQIQESLQKNEKKEKPKAKEEQAHQQEGQASSSAQHGAEFDDTDKLWKEKESVNPADKSEALQVMEATFGKTMCTAKDASGQIIPVPPTQEEYAKAVERGEIEGDLAKTALSIAAKKPLAIKRVDGSYDVYNPDGTYQRKTEDELDQNSVDLKTVS
ncbi:MAG: hypothetical protein KDK65_00340, partial [Chlamydiia bacterium]|nr:hypothetical protein [Chlamydiia bacterium]